ncbi:MAG TPA: iron-sulfur cluster assembly protein [Candidatus Polarisedimenticolaceae bacterium]
MSQTGVDPFAIEQQAIEQIKTVFDPEIPVNIWELGLIYGVEVSPEGRVTVKMTLTSPMCPSAQELPLEVEQKVRSVGGVTDAKVDIVWEPMWTKDMMSDVARLKLGFF